MHLSSITNVVTHTSLAETAKSLYVSSKVDVVFQATMHAIQAHPYIAIGAGTIGIVAALYCGREKIKNLAGSLAGKVSSVASFLYTRAGESMTSLMGLFRQSSSSA